MKRKFSAAAALVEAKSIVADALIGAGEEPRLSGDEPRTVREIAARRRTMLATIVGAGDDICLHLRDAESGARRVLRARLPIVRALLRATRSVGLIVEEDVVVGIVYY